MKTLIAVLLVVASSMNLTFAKSVDPNVTSIEGKVVTINLVDYHSGEIRIDIFDITGTILYTEEVNSNNFSKRMYDLKNFPNGSYTFRLSTSQRIIKKQVVVENSQMHIYEDNVSYSPTFSSDDNIWNLNFLSDNIETTIVITDGNKNLFSETIKNEMTISKSYNLTNLEKGNYYMSIRAGENYYTKTLIKS